jgi:recombinational DNA repair ATPase RecF
MLNGIHLVNFGNHRDTRLTFSGLAELVGQNGSGKTNIMRAVAEIGRFWGDGAEKRGANITAFTRRGAEVAFLTASFPGVRESREGDWGLADWDFWRCSVDMATARHG